MMNSFEEWVPIPKFEGLYEVSNKGNIRNNLRQPIRIDGEWVTLYKNGFSYKFYVQFLVNVAFYNIPMTDEVDDSDSSSLVSQKLF